MKKVILILVLVIVAVTTMTSCTSYRGTMGGGCKATHGYIGYGGRFAGR